MVATLVVPGTWIEHPDRALSFEVQTLLYVLQVDLADANLALFLFEQQRGIESSPPPGDEWQRRQDARHATEERLRAQSSPTSATEWFEAQEAIRFEAEREVAKSRWAQGEMPQTLGNRAVFLHARAFVYALDNIVKMLRVLARHPLPNAADDALNFLDRAVPSIVAVRNTAHHQEDRIRGLDQRGRPLEPQPIASGSISAPGGGVIVLDNLSGSHYGCTLSDGRFAEIDVTADSLLAARDAIQQVLDSFAWTGPRQLWPMN